MYSVNIYSHMIKFKHQRSPCPAESTESTDAIAETTASLHSLQPTIKHAQQEAHVHVHDTIMESAC